MIEGTGSGSVFLTNGSGSGSKRPKNSRSYGSGTGTATLLSTNFTNTFTTIVQNGEKGFVNLKVPVLSNGTGGGGGVSGINR
jgi:hypothetical protein